MDRLKIKKIYRELWTTYGIQAQLNMLMEECAELIQSVNKIIRYYDFESKDIKSNDFDNNKYWNNLAEEMADVEILIDQFKVMAYQHNLQQKINSIKIIKLERVEQRLLTLKNKPGYNRTGYHKSG